MAESENIGMICYIDLIDVCQLMCPTCTRGTRLLANTSKSMSFDLFRAIVEKARSEGYVTIGLYNRTEPFLNKNLPEYISIVKELGCFCDVSSNLSLKGRFNVIERSLAAGLDNLTVSVSGFNQDIYEINHRGGRISYVKENLEYISGLRRDYRHRTLNIRSAIDTKVTLRFIKFDYNIKEEPLLRGYANSLSIAFEVINGEGHPYTPIDLVASEESFLDRLKKYNPSRIYEKHGEICPLILDTISIDCDGNAYLCCAYPNYPVLRLGAYLDMNKNDILMNRYMHPVCSFCQEIAQAFHGTFRRRKTTSDDRAVLVGALVSRLGGT